MNFKKWLNELVSPSGLSNVLAGSPENNDEMELKNGAFPTFNLPKKSSYKPLKGRVKKLSTVKLMGKSPYVSLNKWSIG